MQSLLKKARKIEQDKQQYMSEQQNEPHKFSKEEPVMQDLPVENYRSNPGNENTDITNEQSNAKDMPKTVDSQP